MAKPELKGATVVITRPAAQANHLRELIVQHGGVPLLFPVLAIADVEVSPELDKLLARLDQFDLAIFISRNAVEKGLARVRENQRWPQSLPVAAVGAATAHALRQSGVSPSLVPDQDYSSEGLLAMPELGRLSGKKVIIFRGEGGRETLADCLRQRGAEVRYAECYRRILPATDPEPLRQALSRGEVGFIVVTSNEGLHNLFTLMAASRHLLLNIHYVVLSERTAHAAREMGIKTYVRIAVPASDQGIVEAMLKAS